MSGGEQALAREVQEAVEYEDRKAARRASAYTKKDRR